MFIRYQHVRNVVLGLAAASGIAWCALRDSEPDEPPEQAPPSSTSSTSSTSSDPASSTAQSVPPEPAPEPSPAGSAQAQRYREVMRLTSALAPQKKQKDALGSGNPWKVNLYDDDADGRWDRVKLDRDRDDTWDEKWTHKEGRWEKAAGAMVWDGKAWVSADRLAAPAAAVAADASPAPADAAAAPVPPPAVKLATTPLAHAALVRRMLTGRATGKKLKDLHRGAGAKVNLYDDDKDGRWDRIKIDGDRDETWDEKWTRKGEVIERKLTATGKVLVFRGGAWVPRAP